MSDGAGSDDADDVLTAIPTRKRKFVEHNSGQSVSTSNPSTTNSWGTGTSHLSRTSRYSFAVPPYSLASAEKRRIAPSGVVYPLSEGYTPPPDKRANDERDKASRVYLSEPMVIPEKLNARVASTRPAFLPVRTDPLTNAVPDRSESYSVFGVPLFAVGDPELDGVQKRVPAAHKLPRDPSFAGLQVGADFVYFLSPLLLHAGKDDKRDFQKVCVWFPMYEPGAAAIVRQANILACEDYFSTKELMQDVLKTDPRTKHVTDVILTVGHDTIDFVLSWVLFYKKFRLDCGWPEAHYTLIMSSEAIVNTDRITYLTRAGILTLLQPTHAISHVGRKGTVSLCAWTTRGHPHEMIRVHNAPLGYSVNPIVVKRAVEAELQKGPLAYASRPRVFYDRKSKPAGADHRTLGALALQESLSKLTNVPTSEIPVCVHRLRTRRTMTRAGAGAGGAATAGDDSDFDDDDSCSASGAMERASVANNPYTSGVAFFGYGFRLFTVLKPRSGHTPCQFLIALVPKGSNPAIENATEAFEELYSSVERPVQYIGGSAEGIEIPPLARDEDPKAKPVRVLVVDGTGANKLGLTCTGVCKLATAAAEKAYARDGYPVLVMILLKVHALAGSCGAMPFTGTKVVPTGALTVPIVVSTARLGHMPCMFTYWCENMTEEDLRARWGSPAVQIIDPPRVRDHFTPSVDQCMDVADAFEKGKDPFFDVVRKVLGAKHFYPRKGSDHVTRDHEKRTATWTKVSIHHLATQKAAAEAGRKVFLGGDIGDIDFDAIDAARRKAQQVVLGEAPEGGGKNKGGRPKSSATKRPVGMRPRGRPPKLTHVHVVQDDLNSL